MSVEAQIIADRADEVSGLIDRQRRERRGKDRRMPGSRINAAAPRRSILKYAGVLGVTLSIGAFALTLVGREMLELPVTVAVIGLELAALMTSVLLLALGSIELRLVEIRLELMMLNGGMRGEDRRQGERRENR